MITESGGHVQNFHRVSVPAESMNCVGCILLWFLWFLDLAAQIR